ncbi:MAG TPA: hydroxymethylbilane synthase [Gemmataceae bacterium]|jgi:hydroxymethylbilane synthase|nr:hydroxymethylbilane synthase [Gemmataceae bacterium]
MNLRIATRGSPLALWQARHIADALRAFTASDPVELILVETTGDKVRDRPLSQIGGDGLFTKEIQRALLDGRADVAVHSLKDLPTEPTPGVVLAAVPPRGSTGDAFVSKKHLHFDDLPRNALIATGSLRRQAQLRWRRPDVQLTSIRGNVETRLQKLDEGSLDAIILAQAGLERLQLTHAITEVLDPSWMLPAVGQGALGLECRDGDAATRAILGQLNDPATFVTVAAERAFLRTLGGGCSLPVGVVSQLEGYQIAIRGVLLDPNGRQRLEANQSGPAADPESLGRRLAQDLLEKGGETILLALRKGPEATSLS